MIVHLRELMTKDAEAMLEWMHDANIQKGFQKDMLHMTYHDACSFISKSQLNQAIVNQSSIHYAIVDDRDDYLGTISLKNIDLVEKTAEYAIVVRSNFQRMGVASTATQLLFEVAFEKLKLDSIYLYVIEDNTSAIKCYEKNGFQFACEVPHSVFREEKWIKQLKYIIRKDYYDKSLNNR